MQHTIHAIKVCLNGSRQPGDHPALPVTPQQLAESALGAVAAGAEAIHLHARGGDGAESLRADDVAAAVGAVRRAVPGVSIGVTTGLWITDGDAARRHALVAQWAEIDPAQRPDFASVNVPEPGFAELARLLLTAGIGVEAGVWSAADADRVAQTAPDITLLRILVEVQDPPPEDAVSAADSILARLRRHGLGVPLLLHGETDTCWPLVAYAARLGLPTRIGLEDTLTGPDGEPAADNAALVRLALDHGSAATAPG